MLGVVMLAQALTLVVSGPATSPEYLPLRVAAAEGYFVREGLSVTLETTRAEPGAITIELPFRADLTQQHGFLHAGIITTIVDSACGYAAFSLMPPDAAVLTIEYKINFLAPAAGDRFLATGRVVRPGQAITVCTGDVHAVREGHAGHEGSEKLIATMQATLITLLNRGTLVG